MKKRGRAPDGDYYSIKYERMRNAARSQRMKEYWMRRKAHEAYERGNATPEQMRIVKESDRTFMIGLGIVFGVLIIGGHLIMVIVWLLS